MAALELLCHYLGIDSKQFSKEENLILEADLYTRISDELWESYRSQYKDYFHLFKCNLEKENMMMELNFIRCLIDDILKSEAYTLSGIAYYTQTPEEVIQDLLIGHKISQIITFPRRLIELHKSIRPDMYQNILKKITPPDEAA
jgi:hypothetical protein